MTTLTTRFALAACAAELSGENLTLANGRMTRRWRIGANGLLYPLSFCADGVEWFAREVPVAAPQLHCPLPDEPRAVRLQQSQETPILPQAACLSVDLIAEGAALTVGYRFQIFPDAAGVAMRVWFCRKQPSASAAGATAVSAAAAGVEAPERKDAPADVLPSAGLIERFDAAGPHLRLIQIALQDGTDARNELVFENEWLLQANERDLDLQGNLFILENTLNGNGLIFLKEAPLPRARPVADACDARFLGQNHACAFYGHGFSPEESGECRAPAGVPDCEEMGYRSILLAYSGGVPGRTQALHAYQRSLRPYDPARDGLLLSNTWGDHHRDGCICAEFMHKEIEAGSALGVDVVQIDDGWQKGVSANSCKTQSAGGVWDGFRADPNFWDTDPQRFPQGLLPLIGAARQKGMQFGLWFAPDSAHDFANWRKDADWVLGVHRDCGVNYFKIDAVNIRSKKGERNYHRFVNAVLRESSARVVLDQDVTAGVRPGYWGLPYAGPLFVENRYTDWRGYWPHQTLRNVWKLARYIDPLRLRMEFLNPARNTELYGADPLAQQRYPAEYLFATVMSCSPLGWFETSQLPPEFTQKVSRLAGIWKAHRKAFFSGTIIPVGDVPDGTAWTGFVSVGAQRQSGYLLLFREMNTQGDWTADLRMFDPEPFNTTILAGGGKVTFRNHHLRANLSEPLNFVFARVEMIQR